MNGIIRKLLESYSGNVLVCVIIPELLDFMSNYNNISICGGGKDECLCEVEIALDILGKNYKEINEFIY